MGKTVLGVIAGTFVGALAVEILNRTKPGFTQQVEQKAKDVVGAFVTAFKEGWGDEGNEVESVQPEQSPT